MKNPRTRILVGLVGFVTGAALVSGAGCSSAGNESAPEAGAEGSVDIFAKRTSLSVLVLDPSDNPIPGAAVAIDGTPVGGTTGADGRVSVKAPAGSAASFGVRVFANGYVDNVQVVDTGGATDVSVSASLMKVGTKQSVDAKAGGLVEHAAGSAQFPPDAFVGPDGSPVAGMVDVSVTMVTPDEVGSTGTFGINGRPDEVLQSLGALVIAATQNGKPVAIAPGKTVKLAMPANIPASVDGGVVTVDAGVPPVLPVGTPPPPVWRQNAQKGGWDTTPMTFALEGPKWVAQVDSIATWNCDYPGRVTCMRGSVKTPAGTPLGGAVIKGTMSGTAVGFLPATTVLNATTGSAGTFCMEVVPNSQLKLNIACPNGPAAQAGPFSTPGTTGARCSGAGGSCGSLGTIEACCKVDSDCKIMGEKCVQGVCQMPSDAGMCNGTQLSGANAAETRNVELGKKSGTVSFTWNMQSIKDQMKVVYQGVTLFDTGCVSGTGTKDVMFMGTSTQIQVSVIPNCAGDTSTGWSFSLSCPK